MPSSVTCSSEVKVESSVSYFLKMFRFLLYLIYLQLVQLCLSVMFDFKPLLNSQVP